MKQLNKRELGKLLKESGYKCIRNNGHEIWGNGNQKVAIPVHRINYKLATKIVNQCKLRT